MIVTPADFKQEPFRSMPDDQWFWHVSEGVQGTVMPTWKESLTEADAGRSSATSSRSSPGPSSVTRMRAIRRGLCQPDQPAAPDDRNPGRGQDDLHPRVLGLPRRCRTRPRPVRRHAAAVPPDFGDGSYGRTSPMPTTSGASARAALERHAGLEAALLRRGPLEAGALHPHHLHPDQHASRSARTGQDFLFPEVYVSLSSRMMCPTTPGR